MDFIKLWLSFALRIAGFIWQQVGIALVYIIIMWASLVAAVFLVTKDLWTAAGIVSAICLFRIVQAEFNKEFFGARNPDAIQKQS